jgi:hypothetical protein
MERPLNDGIQKVYKFSNGYGASVVRHSFSYGREQGLWELAVIKFDNEDKWGITYQTPITDDVIGHLTDEDVIDTLTKVSKLPTPALAAVEKE